MSNEAAFLVLCIPPPKKKSDFSEPEKTIGTTRNVTLLRKERKMPIGRNSHVESLSAAEQKEKRIIRMKK